jgi:hypothetical protein
MDPPASPQPAERGDDVFSHPFVQALYELIIVWEDRINRMTWHDIPAPTFAEIATVKQELDELEGLLMVARANLSQGREPDPLPEKYALPARELAARKT